MCCSRVDCPAGVLAADGIVYAAVGCSTAAAGIGIIERIYLITEGGHCISGSGMEQRALIFVRAKNIIMNEPNATPSEVRTMKDLSNRRFREALPRCSRLRPLRAMLPGLGSADFLS